MKKTKEQIQKELNNWEQFINDYKNKKTLNNKDIGQIQLFIKNSIEIYHQVFDGVKYGTYQKLNDQFDLLCKDIKSFYNSIIDIYDLPDINNLYGLETEKTFKTSIITGDGICSKTETVFVREHHKNDFTK